VQQSAYHVGPGDVLKVNVWKNEQLTQQLAVRPDGAITLPLIGDIDVAGKTLEQVDSAIAQQGARFFTEPLSVTTQVIEVKSYRVYVLGEVAKPGEFAPASAVTVLQALSLGGGFTRFASPDEIMVIRKDDKGVRRIPFVYSQVVKNGDMQENVVLQSGDTVVVP
jgi:polysaccharide export outer membrane protein